MGVLDDFVATQQLLENNLQLGRAQPSRLDGAQEWKGDLSVVIDPHRTVQVGRLIDGDVQQVLRADVVGAGRGLNFRCLREFSQALVPVLRGRKLGGWVLGSAGRPRGQPAKPYEKAENPRAGS